MRGRLWAFALALASAGGCGPVPEDATEIVAGDTVPEPPAPDDPLMQAPAGGYADWVADLRAGLDQVVAQAELDRSVAQHGVQRLYESRQQYLVAYFGAAGSAKASEGMAEAVGLVSSYLQELMRQLSTDDVALEQVQESVTGAKAALDRVEAEARTAGLPATAPRAQ